MAIRQPRLSKRRQVTIPRDVLAAAGLSEGQPLSIRATDEGLLITAGEERDPDQWWYWTEEWQKGEREIEAAQARGERGRIFLSDEEFMAHLQKVHEELLAEGR